MPLKTIKAVFLLSALYDIISGVIFGLFYKNIYTYFGVDFPNHSGYIQLPSMFIIVFGIGFLFVFFEPYKNRNIILMGFLMKFGFCAVVFKHYFLDSIPDVYITFGAVDFFFGLLFTLSYFSLKRQAHQD